MRGTWVDSNVAWLLTGTGLGSDTTKSKDYTYDMDYMSNEQKTFNSSKGYQYITHVRRVASGASLSVTTPWLDTLLYDTYNDGLSYITGSPPIAASASGYLYFHSSPISTTTPAKGLNALYPILTYDANVILGTSQSSGIYNLDMNELGWLVQGFSYFKKSNTLVTQVLNQDTLGWTYYPSSNVYSWYDATASLYYPVGGPNGQKKSDFSYRSNNYIGKLVTYAYFNLSFTYQSVIGTTYGISIYTSPTLPSSLGSFVTPSGSTFIAELAYSGTTSSYFFGLQGNQYVFIVGNKSSDGPSASMIVLSNIRIEGAYSDGNNKQYLLTNSNVYANPTTLSPIGLSGSTYSAYVGGGNTVNGTQSLNISTLYSKIGNGNFQAGVWENGVWNSGWRKDDTVYEFYSIDQYFDYEKGKNWRFLISGPSASVSNFAVGNKVSIGNIVAIDINENRKIIKNYFTIISISSTSIVVELTSNFPLRRIEKDSSNHRISVTKNVWLSGAFLNGYFTGVWNYGLFKGYPLITEMFDTHWLDGIFDGGHFKTQYHSPTFSATLMELVPVADRPGAYTSKVGLTFSSPHKLVIGDVITINKYNKSINPQYDGETTIIDVVNDYEVITNVDYGVSETGTSSNGTSSTTISSGVVQNFDFRSHNIGPKTSVQSLDSEAVFVYNSWLDTNYYNTSAVNINKPQTIIDPISRNQYSQNNLYGYPTNDVLSSNSKFRDSYSLNEKVYKLGTKYNIFNDYVGDSSLFEDYFGATGADSVLFIEQGWTFSVSSGTSSLTFSRTIDSGVDPITGKELKVEAIGGGGVLNISTPAFDVRERNTSQIEKQRYTLIEFDMLTYSVSSNLYNYYISSTSSTTEIIQDPVIHFNNINTITRDVLYSGITTSTILKATYLPIHENIDHLKTPNTRKNEYFYGKRNLSMYFKGGGESGLGITQSQIKTNTFIIDNLKFYEVDMIPFFQYFTTANINKSVQIPFQGVAPFIDYTNANFSFLDNLSIGFGSTNIIASDISVSGVGVSIGQGVSVGGGSISSGAGGGDVDIFG